MHAASHAKQHWPYEAGPVSCWRLRTCDAHAGVVVGKQRSHVHQNHRQQRRAVEQHLQHGAEENSPLGPGKGCLAAAISGAASG